MSNMIEPSETGGAPAVLDQAAPPEPAEPADEPQGWVGPSREEWTGLQQQHQALLNWAQQRVALEAQASGPQVPRPDPFADDFHEQLDRYIDAKTAPFAQTYDQMELAAGEELAHDIIADNIAREGEFLTEGSKERAFQLARTFMPQAVHRFGYNDRAGEFALEQACKAVREWEQATGRAYHERQINQLGTLSGARGEPGAAGAATQIQAGPYAKGQRVTDKFFGGGQR